MWKRFDFLRFRWGSWTFGNLHRIFGPESDFFPETNRTWIWTLRRGKTGWNVRPEPPRTKSDTSKVQTRNFRVLNWKMSLKLEFHSLWGNKFFWWCCRLFSPWIRRCRRCSILNNHLESNSFFRRRKRPWTFRRFEFVWLNISKTNNRSKWILLRVWYSQWAWKWCNKTFLFCWVFCFFRREHCRWRIWPWSIFCRCIFSTRWNYSKSSGLFPNRRRWSCLGRRLWWVLRCWFPRWRSSDCLNLWLNRCGSRRNFGKCFCFFVRKNLLNRSLFFRRNFGWFYPLRRCFSFVRHNRSCLNRTWFFCVRNLCWWFSWINLRFQKIYSPVSKSSKDTTREFCWCWWLNCWNNWWLEWSTRRSHTIRFFRWKLFWNWDFVYFWAVRCKWWKYSSILSIRSNVFQTPSIPKW